MRSSITGFFLAAFAVGGMAYALQHHGHGPHHPDHGWTPAYDVSREVTRSGVVVELETVADCRGCDSGIHLWLDGQPTEIHVGPSSYLEDQHWLFAKGDAVTILGSETTVAGSTILLAREIHRGDQTLVLRDASGRPKWRAPSGPRD